MSSSRIFSIVCLILGELGSELLAILTETISSLADLSSLKIGDFRFDPLFMLSQVRTRLRFRRAFSCSLSRCSSISVSFPTLFSSSPLILVSALSMPRNSRMSRSVLVLIFDLVTSANDSSSLSGRKIVHFQLGWNLLDQDPRPRSDRRGRLDA